MSAGDAMKFSCPLLVVGGEGGLTVLPVGQTDAIERIERWMRAGNDNDRRTGAAVVELIKMDERRAIFLNAAGPIRDHVSYVVALAYGYDPAMTTMHWTTP